MQTATSKQFETIDNHDFLKLNGYGRNILWWLVQKSKNILLTLKKGYISQNILGQVGGPIKTFIFPNSSAILLLSSPELAELMELEKL